MRSFHSLGDHRRLHGGPRAAVSTAPPRDLPMKILLDTNTCSNLIRRRSPKILARLRRWSPGDIGISSITLAELAFGAAKSGTGRKTRHTNPGLTAAAL